MHENGFFALFCKTLHFRLPICAVALPTTETPLRVCATALKRKQNNRRFHSMCNHSTALSCNSSLIFASPYTRCQLGDLSSMSVSPICCIILRKSSSPTHSGVKSIFPMHTDRLCKRISGTIEWFRCRYLQRLDLTHS